jgi:hypothetical protein
MPFRRAVVIPIFPLLAGVLTGCGDCAGVGRPAFEVTVVDAGTGASLSDSATVYVFQLPELIRVDSATRQMSEGRIWTSDRKGRFKVVVERPGYYPWTAENREVRGECSTETVFLTARLIPRAL